MTDFPKLPKMCWLSFIVSLGEPNGDDVEEILVLGISTSSSEDVVKGDTSYFVNYIDVCNLDSSICLMDRLLPLSEGYSKSPI